MIQVFTTGGTIDKVYHDAKSEFTVGDSLLPELLEQARVGGDYRITELLRKDSLELTDADRETVHRAVAGCDAGRILITHGTDTMADTARVLAGIGDKTIVLLGAMQPARMQCTDAPFNLGFAWAAVSLLPAGVYVAMNGQVFAADAVRKNRRAGRFEGV